MDSEETKLTARDHTVNVFQGILKGVPYVGASLEHFIFGPLAEARMRRIEVILTNISNSLHEASAANNMCSERFVNLLEEVTPDLSRAVDLEKLGAFQSLLLNAAQLSPEAQEWSEAQFAADLLKRIEAPGLDIIAALARCSIRYPLTIASVPRPQVHEGKEFDYETPPDPQHSLHYKWVVIEEWAHRLREMRLVSYQSSDARGGFGGVQFGPLGDFVVRWLIATETHNTQQVGADQPATAPESKQEGVFEPQPESEGRSQ